jgi:hypothetical protein
MYSISNSALRQALHTKVDELRSDDKVQLELEDAQHHHNAALMLDLELEAL